MLWTFGMDWPFHTCILVFSNPALRPLLNLYQELQFHVSLKQISHDHSFFTRVLRYHRHWCLRYKGTNDYWVWGSSRMCWWIIILEILPQRDQSKCYPDVHHLYFLDMPLSFRCFCNSFWQPHNYRTCWTKPKKSLKTTINNCHEIK